MIKNLKTGLNLPPKRPRQIPTVLYTCRQLFWDHKRKGGESIVSPNIQRGSPQTHRENRPEKEKEEGGSL